MYITHLAINNLLRTLYSQQLIERPSGLLPDTVLNYSVKPYSKKEFITLDFGSAAREYELWFPMVEVSEPGIVRVYQYLLPFKTEEEAAAAAMEVAKWEAAYLREALDNVLKTIEKQLGGGFDGTGDDELRSIQGAVVGETPGEHTD
jgi:hypothetical protein